MKFTFALFNKHKRKRKNKIIINESRSNNFRFKMDMYTLFLIVIAVIFSILNNDMIIFATSFVDSVDNIVSIEKLAYSNLLVNSSCYKFKEIEKAQCEEIVDYYSTPEELAMDKVANSYSKDISVFGRQQEVSVEVVTENNNYQKLKVCGIDVTNYSSNRNIDFEKIINMEDKYFEAEDEITMYTTHTSESYANSDEYRFDYSAPARTLDGRYNMLSIATTLARNLNIKNINTVCSLNPHDYGEYNSAYTNSRATLSSIIQENTNVKIAIDVHRDAIEDLSFAPKLDIMGYNVACVMLVMGIGYDDFPNPYYEQNLKLAFELQMLAEKIYPGLFRPMIIRDSVYNQDLMPNSFLIEIGATGNTIDEAKLATRCLSNLLNIIYNH